MRFSSLVLLIALSSGCGGDSPSADPAPGPLPDAELRRQIDAFLGQRRVTTERGLVGRIGRVVELISELEQELAARTREDGAALSGRVAEGAQRAGRLRYQIGELGGLDAQTWEQRRDQIVAELRRLEKDVDEIGRELEG